MTDRLRTKIVCTIGPASREPETLLALIAAGMDVARLNFSHGDLEYHGESIRRIRDVSHQVDKPVAILCDLQGPKLRVGLVPGPGMALETGQTLVLTTRSDVAEPGHVPVQYEHLPQAVQPGDRILLDDGLIELSVTSIEGTEIATTVVIGGLLTSNKGMNLPAASVAIPAITEKDRENLRFALDQQVDWVAQSFVRTADEVLELKGLIREFSVFGRATPVIAKIEKPEAVQNFEQIIAVADGIMVARGDLGIETSPEAVPMVQKMIIQHCNQAGKPVITATQMLDSMIRNPRPTRAEASDVANAILDGSDAIMLSGETAAGKYPVLAVQTMARIAREAEAAQAARPARQVAARPGRSLTEAVAHASVETAIDLSAAAIIAPTVSGATAHVISRFRPPCPVVAVTPSPIAQRELMLYWGVYPLLAQRTATTDEVIADAVAAAQAHGFAAEGDLLVITAGAVGSGIGTTSLMKVHLIERVLAHGIGLGDQRVIGRVRRLEAPLAPDVRVQPDEIVVASCTDRTFVNVMRRAAGLITDAQERDAHCRLLALELGVPAVVGIQEDLDSFSEGMHVVIDARRGLVYERPAALVRGTEERCTSVEGPNIFS